MTRAAEMIDRIEQENGMAEKYLLSGVADGSAYATAVEILVEYLPPISRCLLESRREIEKEKKYKSGRQWVIKTQFVFNKFAEMRNLPITWISESKIKREWRRMIFLVTEIAIRLDKSVDNS